MLRSFLVLLIVASLPPAALPQPSGSSDMVQLTVVRLPDLEKAIKGHEGKIVVVYMWGDYSAPDRKTLADVVLMQQRMSKAPVVFLTVCHSSADRDDPKEYEKRRARNLELLKKTKASFQNFVPDENDEVWATKLRFLSGPTFNVHDKSGKRVKTFSLVDGEYRLDEVEKLVNELEKKPSAK